MEMWKRNFYGNDVWTNLNFELTSTIADGLNDGDKLPVGRLQRVYGSSEMLL